MVDEAHVCDDEAEIRNNDIKENEYYVNCAYLGRDRQER